MPESFLRPEVLSIIIRATILAVLELELKYCWTLICIQTFILVNIVILYTFL